MIEKKKETSPWQHALQQLDEVAERMDLEPWIHKKLRHPRRELIVSIPVRMDDGSVEVFTGYRVQHNITPGPAKGGIRYHPDVTLDGDESSCHVDDLEMRCGWFSLWGCQRRSAV